MDGTGIFCVKNSETTYHPSGSDKTKKREIGHTVCHPRVPEEQRWVKLTCDGLGSGDLLSLQTHFSYLHTEKGIWKPKI